MNMQRRWLFLVGITISQFGTSATAATQAEIDKAISQGVEFLKGQQADNGMWNTGHTLGATALATLALLESGVPVNDPAVSRPLNQVRQQIPQNTHTYTVSLAIMLLDRAGDKRDRPLIKSLGERLAAGQTASGGWSYGVPDRAATERGNRVIRAGGRGDNSNTQFAVLGLWVARRHGADVDQQLATAGRYFQQTMSQSTGWGYTPGSAPSPSMTCAGLIALATLYGTQSSLQGGKSLGAARDKRPGGGDDEEKASPKAGEDRQVQAALRYLENSIQGRNQSQFSDLYFTWSLERVAVIYGLQRIGTVDWYASGSEYCVGSQRPDGSWNARWGTVPETSFVLLFLNRSNFAPDLTKLVGGPSTLTAGTDLTNLKQMAATAIQRGQDRAVATSAAEQLLEQLREAEDDKSRLRVLVELRDAKGAVYSYALASAITLVDGEVKQAARAALASRFERMTTKTLQGKLASDDAETRSAAILAATKKQERELLPQFVQCLLDADQTVRQNAAAGLQTLTGQDFGPGPNASTAEYFAAQKRWEQWLARQP